MAKLEQANLYTTFRNRAFVIPDYQRGYAWTTDELDDLIEDLDLLVAGKDHFFGTLVLRAIHQSVKDDEKNEFGLFEVVDGQQRLTTVTIFLNLIQREMQKLPEEFGRVPEGVRKNYLFVCDGIGQQIPKIKLNRDCREYFETHILGLNGGVMVPGPTIRSHRLLLAAHQYAQAHLARLRDQHDSAYPQALDELAEKLTKQLKLIVYEVDDEMDAAGLIFAAMNNRGQPLKQLDLVKNYILYVSSRLVVEGENRLRDLINATWTDVFEHLAQIDEDDRHENLLLRYHWVASYSGNIKPVNSDTITGRFSLKDHAADHLDLYQKLIEYLKSLRMAAAAYRDVCRPGHSDAFGEMRPDLRPQIKTISQKLARLGVLATFQPLLISVRLKAQDQGETYLKVVDACERFAFRIYRWAGWQTRTAQSKFYGLARQYYTGQKSNADLVRDIVSWIYEYCSDARFKERYEQATNDWYHWAGIEYLLYEYERHLAEQAQVSVHLTWEGLVGKPKDESVEHILPQAPTNPYWAERFSPEVFQRWINDIGNLVLTFYNPSLGNKSFPKKRGSPAQPRCYASSPYLSERELALVTDWTPAEIQARRERLRAWSLERWKIPVLPAKTPASQEPANQGASAQKGTEVKWRDLPPEERRLKVLQKFNEWAEHAGTSIPYHLLLETLKRFPLYLYLNPVYAGLQFSLLRKRTTWVVWFDPNLYIHYHPDRFSQVTGVSKEEIASLIGPEKQTLKPEQAAAYAAGLEQILAAMPSKPKP